MIPDPLYSPTVRRSHAQEAEVRAVQLLLGFTRHSRSKRLDGSFGPTTELEVQRFQSAHGLEADGIVGPLTWQALRDAGRDGMGSPAPIPAATSQAALARRWSATGIPHTELQGSGQQYWPIRSKVYARDVAQRGGRSFGAPRSSGGRYHAGVDLYGEESEAVVAPFAGQVLAAPHFYRGTHGLFLYSEELEVTVNLGEVANGSWIAWGVAVGNRVRAGQAVAMVGMMRDSAMTHLEIYVGRHTRNVRAYRGHEAAAAGRGLRNPTGWLLELAALGR